MDITDTFLYGVKSCNEFDETLDIVKSNFWFDKISWR